MSIKITRRLSLRCFRGLTLVEVVVAIALAGTLLTSTLIAGSKHLRQTRAAERKLESIERLDRCLTTWSSDRFDPKRLAAAVDVFEQNKDAVGTAERYVLRVNAVSGSPLGAGTTIRLTATTLDSAGVSHPGAWIEILVPWEPTELTDAIQ